MFYTAGLSLNTAVAPVIQRLDSAIQRVHRCPVDKYWQNKHAIHWIVIYPVDSVIHPFYDYFAECEIGV